MKQPKQFSGLSILYILIVLFLVGSTIQLGYRNYVASQYFLLWMLAAMNVVIWVRSYKAE